METLQSIYFVLGILWIYACTAFGFVWYIWHQGQDQYWQLENAREERQKLIAEFREQLVDQSEIMSKERKDLYDRLQAGTLTQYKEHAEAPNETNEAIIEDETVPLDEAKEELING